MRIHYHMVINVTQRLCDVAFSMFALTWVYTRLAIYPTYLIYSTRYVHKPFLKQTQGCDVNHPKLCVQSIASPINIRHIHKSTWLEYFGSTELQSLLRKGFASGFCTMKPSLLYKMLFFKSRMVDNSHTSERCHWTTAASWICTFSIFQHLTQYFNNQRRTPALASRRDRSWRCSQPTMSSTSSSPPFSSSTSSGVTSSSKSPTRWENQPRQKLVLFSQVMLADDTVTDTRSQSESSSD